MSQTDNPLKRFLIETIEDLASWLLGQPVKRVKHEQNVELPVSNISSDQVFRVTLADGKDIILHIEYEASSSVDEMRWRMLRYMVRLAEKFDLEVHSVVLYIGGKGKGDMGKHKEGNLAWQYRVIRLQDIQAKELLETNQLALLPLIGLTNLQGAEKECIEAVEVIKRKSEGRLRRQFLTFLVELIPDGSLLEMIETHLEKDDLLLNTPFLQKIRGQGREEGREEGIGLGVEKERLNIARNMKQEGMELDVIAKLTGLSVDEVQGL